jgi:hypothetical protein
MGNDKSIVEKISDALKGLANIAADAANDALKAEAPKSKPDEAEISYMPLATEGLVSDPMMEPPIAVAPVRRRKRTTPKRATKKAAQTMANQTMAKEKTIVKNARKKPAARKSKKVAKNTDKKPFKKT